MVAAVTCAFTATTVLSANNLHPTKKHNSFLRQTHLVFIPSIIKACLW